MKLTHAAMTLLLALAIVGRAVAQAPGNNPSGALYRPGSGDLMTMTIQPRHIKLALAGRAGNWSYAAYELHELKEAFDRAMGVWPQWQSFPVGEMARSALREPFDALEQAIKGGDGTGFTSAYRRLTDACGACHEAADRKIVVIRVPDQDAFPDQAFEPVMK